MIDEDRHAKQLADDPFYNSKCHYLGTDGVGPHLVHSSWLIKLAVCAEVMKNINTVAIDELSPEQIEAARKRRMRERCGLTPLASVKQLKNNFANARYWEWQAQGYSGWRY